ncbi:MAG: methionyl-tRNA formyltransferase [Paracoccaceae bacterium]
MRIVFMGTPEFSVLPLAALIAAGHDIAAVYTRPPRPAGRGKQPRRSPVHEFADGHGMVVKIPPTLRDPAAQREFAGFRPDAGVVAAYGLILPRAILDAPAHGCLNIHASLLPRWRGAAPIQRAIMARDAETGVCIMQMDAGLDTGPVLLREATAITPQDTAGSLHDRLAGIGARLIVEALADPGALQPEPQPAEGITYAAKIDKAEARIDWTRPAAAVDAHVRGLSPFPGAWTTIGGERVKALFSEVAAGRGLPGRVLGDDLTVACGEGAVRLLRLQRPGRAPMEAGDFLRGFPVAAGDRAQ